MHRLLELNEPKILELLSISVDQIQDWLVITDVEGTILYTNKQTEKISGYEKHEIIGQKPSLWKSGECKDELYKELWDTILSGKPFHGVVANRKKSGEIFYLANTISPVIKNGEIAYFVSVAKDITQNYKLKQQLHDIIHFDSLTGLFNLKSFKEEVKNAVNAKENIAILTLSINKMNMINTTYGFNTGDNVIREICNKIKTILPSNHIFARIDNHIFAILIPRFKSLSSIVTIIKKIEKTVGNSITIKNKEIYIELSAGVSIYPVDAQDETQLITRSQIALSKSSSKNGVIDYRFYAPEMNMEVKNQLYMENDLYKAYENNEFIPYFQPFVDLKTGAICGFESLMRRKKQTGEIVTPGVFISVLEDIGIIDKVELSYLRNVCIEIKKWIDKGFKVVPVAVNISPTHFSNRNLANEILEIIEDVGIPRHLITIEITESIFVEDMELAKMILRDLKEKGFIIAIDDFGTGYSTFSYLKEFNADYLKIDMSFVKDILDNKSDQAIVKSIISIAKILDMKTVAEGIENGKQAKMLQDFGCEIGQGYYWDVAKPAHKIEEKYY